MAAETSETIFKRVFTDDLFIFAEREGDQVRAEIAWQQLSNGFYERAERAYLFDLKHSNLDKEGFKDLTDRIANCELFTFSSKEVFHALNAVYASIHSDEQFWRLYGSSGELSTIVGVIDPAIKQIGEPMRKDAADAALLAAAANGEAGAVRALLPSCDVDCRGDRDGAKNATPLMLAAMHNHEGCAMALLVQGGADEKAVNDEGKTAVELARQFGHDELAEQIEAAALAVSERAQLEELAPRGTRASEPNRV